MIAGESKARIQIILNPAGDLYMRRHFISERRASPQIWVHEILLPDEDRWCHDHPWDYRTVILQGGYREEHDGQLAAYEEGDALQREAESFHRLHLSSPAVTLFMAARQRRRWGFATDQGWIDGVAYQAQRSLELPGAGRSE